MNIFDVATQYTVQTIVLWWVVINFSFFSFFYFFWYHLCLFSPFFFFLLFFHFFCLGHFGMLFPFNFVFLGCCICLLLEFLLPFLMQQYKTSPTTSHHITNTTSDHVTMWLHCSYLFPLLFSSFFLTGAAALSGFFL